VNMDCRRLLLDMFKAAVEPTLPARWLPCSLLPLTQGRAVVVGAGKAAAIASERCTGMVGVAAVTPNF
jgi:glycerate-2-kinase